MSISTEKLNADFKPYNLQEISYVRKARVVADIFYANETPNKDDVIFIRKEAHSDNEHLKGDYLITQYLNIIALEAECDRFNDEYIRAKRYAAELEKRITNMKEYIALLEEETDKWKGKGKTAKAFKEHGEAVLNLAKEGRGITSGKKEKGIAETVGLSPTTVIAILDEWRKMGEYEIPKRVGAGRKPKTANNSAKLSPSAKTLETDKQREQKIDERRKFTLSVESYKNYEALLKKRRDKRLKEDERKE